MAAARRFSLRGLIIYMTAWAIALPILRIEDPSIPTAIFIIFVPCSLLGIAVAVALDVRPKIPAGLIFGYFLEIVAIFFCNAMHLVRG